MARIGAGGPSSVGKTGAARARRAKSAGESSPASRPAAPEDIATIAGIPEAELTPNVRSAILRLMQEVDELRRQLAYAQKRAEQLEQVADEDPMLPVLNRRAFVRELSRAQSLAQRHGIPSSLVYLDVNGMKAINDTHGHAAGDAVLLNICQRLREQLRQADVVGRLGGDELGVILVHTDEAAAALKARSLVDVIREKPVSWSGTELPVSLAYGHAALSGGEAQEALAAADRAMYASKVRRRS